MGVDEGGDGVGQLTDAVERAAADLLIGDLAEEPFDEVEPRAVLGRERELEAAGGRVASQALVSREMCAE